MTDAQLDLYRRLATEAHASAHPQPSRWKLAETIDSLIAEIDHLRKVEAAGERLADVCRALHFAQTVIGRVGRDVGRPDDLGTALDALDAARRGEVAP